MVLRPLAVWEHLRDRHNRRKNENNFFLKYADLYKFENLSLLYFMKFSEKGIVLGNCTYVKKRGAVFLEIHTSGCLEQRRYQ